MTLERKLVKLFYQVDNNLVKCVNPWSVWTRYIVVPFVFLAFWSRIWIGWWCLVPCLLSILWMFFLPTVFSQPKSTKNWASKSVLGERVYLNRDKIPIPNIHKKPLHIILHCISAIGLLLATWATITYSVWGITFGISLAYLGRSWFLDRMVWLYEDMKDTDEEYASWEY